MIGNIPDWKDNKTPADWASQLRRSAREVSASDTLCFVRLSIDESRALAETLDGWRPSIQEHDVIDAQDETRRVCEAGRQALDVLSQWLDDAGRLCDITRMATAHAKQKPQKSACAQYLGDRQDHRPAPSRAKGPQAGRRTRAGDEPMGTP